jgi:hypothetical protein
VVFLIHVNIPNSDPDPIARIVADLFGSGSETLVAVAYPTDKEGKDS